MIADAEDELEKVLESIVSSSQETLVLSQNEAPNPQLSTIVNSCPSTNNPSTAIPVEQLEATEEAVSTPKGSGSLSQNGTLEEVDGNNKVANSFS